MFSSLSQEPFCILMASLVFMTFLRFLLLVRFWLKFSLASTSVSFLFKQYKFFEIVHDTSLLLFFRKCFLTCHNVFFELVSKWSTPFIQQIDCFKKSLLIGIVITIQCTSCELHWLRLAHFCSGSAASSTLGVCLVWQRVFLVGGKEPTAADRQDSWEHGADGGGQGFSSVWSVGLVVCSHHLELVC